MIKWPTPHELSRVIVVAGPSGAGKSTFMRHVATGQLSPEIQSHLPTGVETWMQIGHARAELKRYAPHFEQLPWLGTERQQAPPVGLILAYDLTRSAHAYVKDYAGDPMLHVLLMASELIIINLRPEPDRLLRQWAYANMGADTHVEIKRKELMWRVAMVAERAAGAFRRISPSLLRRIKRLRYVKAARKKVRAQLAGVRKDPRLWLAIYRRSDRVETLFDRWQAFLATMAAQGVEIRQIDLEPEPCAPIADHSDGLGERCRWRLARTEPTPSDASGDVAYTRLAVRSSQQNRN